MECCFEKQADGLKRSKYCVYIAYPNHPRNLMRKECGALLLQKVVKSTSLYDLRQFRTYVYQPLESALGHLLLRANFLKLTEHWRNLPVIDNCFLRDIYCGEVWKEFQCPNGRNFLAAPYSLATMINVDWFQPFTHVKYSVGVIYLVILNLPREERYKLENIIVVGIIPGPKEPKKNVNSFLVPLMEDLHKFWNGVSMKASIGGVVSSIVVRLAIICAACDIPALRKLCGFAGHSAAMGCSKCRYRFKSCNWD